MRTRVLICLVAGAAMASAAAATTLHTNATSSTSGSEGALTTLQTSANSSAFQGEVAARANTGLKIPFGVLGEYDASTSTFGIGVAGISTSGYGVAAEAFGYNPSLLAETGAAGDAIDAVASAGADAMVITVASSGFGIIARANSGSGVYGEATSGYGTLGYSVSSVGAYGSSGTNYGVEGSTGGSSPAAGVIGMGNTYGYGVVGQNSSTATPSPYAGDGSALAALVGQSGGGPGMYANSTYGFGAFVSNHGQVPTLYIDEVRDHDPEGGLQIAAANGYFANEDIDFEVNYEGDVLAQGQVLSGQQLDTISRNPANAMVTYAPAQAEPSMEDVGNARLIDGSATVALAADFRQTIDPSSPYAVFLTPYGDNRGLYVASRTASGFVVREAQGGRSSLSFDYRIVARPYGTRTARLPHFKRDEFPRLATRGARTLVAAAHRAQEMPLLAPAVIPATVRAHVDASIARARKNAQNLRILEH